VPQFLTYSYNSVAQEVVCAEDAISSLPGILDRLGSTRAMVVCGPSILEKSNVVQRAQEPLETGVSACSQASRPTRRSTLWTRQCAWPRTRNQMP
jgi:alcohol dehydrogenase class IV